MLCIFWKTNIAIGQFTMEFFKSCLTNLIKFDIISKKLFIRVDRENTLYHGASESCWLLENSAQGGCELTLERSAESCMVPSYWNYSKVGLNGFLAVIMRGHFSF